MDRALQATMENRPSVLQDASPGNSATRTARLISLGAILAALAAASCCLVPFVLLSVGVTGAWVLALGSLARYQPIFVVLAAASLAGGFRLIYRKPKASCADGSYCARPASDRVVKVVLWSATALVGTAIVFTQVTRALL